MALGAHVIPCCLPLAIRNLRPGWQIQTSTCPIRAIRPRARERITRGHEWIKAMPNRRKHIAVIDDDASVCKALGRQMCAAGFIARQFSSAEEFLASAPGGFACVICDIHLGGMTGLELALHPVISERNLPVILISGCGDPVFEEPAQLVAAAFLHKPIPPGTLLDTIIDTVGPPLEDDEH